MEPLKPSRRPSWLVIALLASLGANMFIGGFLFGRQGPFGGWGPPPGPPPFGPPGPHQFLRHLADQLPVVDGDRLRAAATASQGAFEADEARRREAHDRMRRALMADPFDAKALAAAMTEHDTADLETRQRVKGLIIEAASAMSPEGRRAMANFRPGPPGPPPGAESRR